MYKLVATILLLLFAQSPWNEAVAKIVLLDKPVSVQQRGLHQWVDAFSLKWKRRLDDLDFSHLHGTQCAQIKEIPGCYLCVSYLQETMNYMFTRISSFAEGGYDPARSPIRDWTHEYHRSNLLRIGGHDIKGRDIIDFYRIARKRGILHARENEFGREILPKLRKKHGDRFVVLSVSVQGEGFIGGTVGHEAMHAQFFLDEPYRTTTIKYHKDLHWRERKAMEQLLGDLKYDTRDKILMANEIMAYLLEPGGETRYFKEWVPRCANELRQLLIAAGTPPIEVPLIDPILFPGLKWERPNQ